MSARVPADTPREAAATGSGSDVAPEPQPSEPDAAADQGAPESAGCDSHDSPGEPDNGGYGRYEAL